MKKRKFCQSNFSDVLSKIENRKWLELKWTKKSEDKTIVKDRKIKK